MMTQLSVKKFRLLHNRLLKVQAQLPLPAFRLAWAIGFGLAALALIAGLGIAVVRRRNKAAQAAAEESLPGKVEYPTLDLESVQ